MGDSAGHGPLIPNALADELLDYGNRRAVIMSDDACAGVREMWSGMSKSQRIKAVRDALFPEEQVNSRYENALNERMRSLFNAARGEFERAEEIQARIKQDSGVDSWVMVSLSAHGVYELAAWMAFEPNEVPE